MSAYSELLQSVCISERGMCEESAVFRLPNELQLQALWFAGQMGRDFVAVDGRLVRVVQFGYWNHGAGPDFLHAAVEIDGVIVTGALELDHHASDWESHGHAENEAFNGVVLHVVFAPDTTCHFTRTAEHREVPRVCVSESILREALDMPIVDVANAHPGRCFKPLAEMDVEYVDSLMLAAAKHRAQKKSLRKQRVIDVMSKDEWLWQALAETLGYRPNKLAMTLLAQRFPVQKLLKMPDDMEAALFGAAGFLAVDIHKEAVSDSQDYLRDLWQGWWRIRGEYEPVKERAVPWKLSGIRPVNHPQRRLACLSLVAAHWSQFKKLPETQSGIESVADFFQHLKHPFWHHHYTLKSKRSDQKLSLMGGDRVKEFQVNHLLPEKLAAGEQWAWSLYQKLPASAVSEKVQKASIRLFGNSPKRKAYLKKAWYHQALLQIYQDFCLQDVTDCAECPFPEQLAQWRG